MKMKKALLIMLGVFLGISAPLFAEVNSNTLTPIVVERTTSAMTLYIVGGATTSAASYQVCADSIAFTTADGLYPGTTHVVFADAHVDTLGELITYLNAIPTTTAGVEGGIVAAIVNGAYDGNASSELTASAITACKGSVNIKTLAFDNILGMSYTLPVSGLKSGQQYHITGLNVNATFAEGTTNLTIYNGSSSSSSKILKYEVDTSATETPVKSVNSELAGSERTAMRFDVVGSTWITSGYMSISGFKK
jgi:hypothetical protein